MKWRANIGWNVWCIGNQFRREKVLPNGCTHVMDNSMCIIFCSSRTRSTKSGYERDIYFMQVNITYCHKNFKLLSPFISFVYYASWICTTHISLSHSTVDRVQSKIGTKGRQTKGSKGSQREAEQRMFVERITAACIVSDDQLEPDPSQELNNRDDTESTGDMTREQRKRCNQDKYRQLIVVNVKRSIKKADGERWHSTRPCRKEFYILLG